ncbi:hypothetical protein LINPERPRIM_LOCUS4263, partial [Linum perenne]
SLKFVVLIFLVAVLVTTFSESTDDDDDNSICDVGSTPHKIVKGDTCWELVHGDQDKLDDIPNFNPGINCA